VNVVVRIWQHLGEGSTLFCPIKRLAFTAASVMSCLHICVTKAGDYDY